MNPEEDSLMKKIFRHLMKSTRLDIKWALPAALQSEAAGRAHVWVYPHLPDCCFFP